MLTTFDKLINPLVITLLNIVLVVATEFAGGGTFFSDTGLVHGIVVVFVVLIVVRILSEYAYGDGLLKTFSKIQVGFFLFLGLIHIYEYSGLNVFPIRDEIVELSVLVAYLLWFFGNLVALAFIFRSYYKKSAVLFWTSSLVTGAITFGLLWLNISPTFVDILPTRASLVTLALVIVLAIVISMALWKITKIMPIFRNYAMYAIPGTIFVVLASCSEYSEATEFLGRFGVSSMQNLYLSHFAIFAGLSMLLIAVGKFKKPTGIYADM